MQKELERVDITDIPDLLRLVEEVRRSNRPRVLKHGSDEVAILSPVEPQPAAVVTRKRRARTIRTEDPQGNIIATTDATSPAASEPKPPGHGKKTARSNDWLLRLADITAALPLPIDGATDVSSNKHKYLAEAYYPTQS